MPLKVRRWPQAIVDQYDVWLAIAHDSIRAADAVLGDLDAAARMLGEFPEAGRAREELGQGVRYYPVGSYLIFYTISRDFLEIRRIMHGARDIKSELFGD